MPASRTTTWEAAHIPAHHPHLERDITADVAIVGGGLVGVLTAYLLGKVGKDVVVLEAKELGAGATMATTAFLTSSIDTDATDLIPMFGLDRARKIRESHESAIDLIEQIVRDEQIDCDFSRCSNWIFANPERSFRDLEEEYRAMQRLGYDVTLHRHLDNGFANNGAIEVRSQAKFHPIRFLQGVAKAAEAAGVHFFEKTRVSRISGCDPVRIEAGPHLVRAEYAITATYDPLGNPLRTFAKKGMYTSYVYEAEIPAGLITEGIYEDTENPYHYFRVDRGEQKDRLIIGGEDHRHEIPLAPRKNFTALREYLDELLDGQPYTVTRQWSGPILEPSDGLPLIGKLERGQLVAAAFSGNGMTYAAIAAQVFESLTTGSKHPWKTLYDPRRIPRLRQLWRKGRDYTAELLNGAVRNFFR